MSRLELFFGTGGVGKTTLAASRAYYLAKNGDRVLLMTIDPSRRLKQLLDLDGKLTGEPHHIPWGGFHALLFSPDKTLERIANESNLSHEFSNPILKILSKPHGGMNEIISLLEIDFQIRSNQYDTIIIDTAPGKHFLDFLNSAEKLKAFFNPLFLEIFKATLKSEKIFSLFVSTGLKKLLSYLEHVTGKLFIERFLAAVRTIYQAKDSFISALSVHKELLKENDNNWYLVTSIEQQKIDQALEIKGQMEQKKITVLVNRTLGLELKNWTSTNPLLVVFKNSLISREEKALSLIKRSELSSLFFPETNLKDFEDQIRELSTNWKKI